MPPFVGNIAICMPVHTHRMTELNDFDLNLNELMLIFLSFCFIGSSIERCLSTSEMVLFVLIIVEDEDGHWPQPEQATKHFFFLRFKRRN